MGCEQSSNSKRSLKMDNSEKSKSVIVKESMSKKGTQPVTNHKPEAGTLHMDRIQTLLEDYIQSENRIRHMEQSDPVTVFYIKKSQLIQVERKIQDRLNEIQDLKQNTEEKELEFEEVNEMMGTTTVSSNKFTDARQSSLRNVLIKLGDKKLSTGDHRTIVWTTKLEIAMTELEMLYQEKALNENDVKELFGTLSQIKEEYRRQFDILDELGIEEELGVDELIELESRRITISETLERWKEGRIHIIEACSQFSKISERLNELGNEPEKDSRKQDAKIDEQYQMGEEIRDGLVAVWQSLGSVKFYLGSLPYCTDAELVTLQKAMRNLFIDLKSGERRKHAQNCYEAFHKRTVALLVWVDKTIETVITPVLKAQNDDIYKKAKELSMARVQKIQRKFPTLDWNKIQSPNGNNKKQYLKCDKNTETINQAKEKYNQKLFTLMDMETKKIFSDLEFTNLANIPKADKLFDFSSKSVSPSSVRVSRSGGRYSEADTLSIRTVPSGQEIRKCEAKNGHFRNEGFNLTITKHGDGEHP